MDVQELVGLVPWTFVAQICNLFIQMYLIKRFLFKPVNEMLEKRRALADAQIREAEQAKLEGKQKTILFNLSGHGLIDMAAYDQYLAGDLTNYVVTDEEVANNLKDLEHLI